MKDRLLKIAGIALTGALYALAKHYGMDDTHAAELTGIGVVKLVIGMLHSELKV